MSDLNKRCLDSWRKFLPGYQIKEWNETNSHLEDAYCQAAYAGGLWSRLSNHVRLRALLAEGGIYLDTDVEVVRDFEPLLRHKCFLGFQQEEEEADWINNAVMGAEPGHQFLQRCMELTLELFAQTGEFYRAPTINTRVLKEKGLRGYGLQEIGGVTVYPAEYFYPFPWFGKFSPGCVTESTYCIHHWEASWKKSGFHKIMYPLRRMKRMMRSRFTRV